jgi:hypothetical protein
MGLILTHCSRRNDYPEIQTIQATMSAKQLLPASFGGI